MTIFWLKVWAIALLQGAITLCWVVYSFYIPSLLKSLGFSASLALTLLIIESFLEAIIEPIFGALSDEQKKRLGTKFSLIAFGAILASGLLIILPAIAIFGNPESIWRWLLPILAVLWASAMAIFRSPTISLLDGCAGTEKMPEAVSILTLIKGLIDVFRFETYGLILKLGAPFAFAIGSFALLAGIIGLRFFDAPEPILVEAQPRNKIAFTPLIMITLTGVSIAAGLRLIMPTIATVFTLNFGKESGKFGMMLFLLLLAISAIPAGKLASKFGNTSSLIIALVISVLCLEVLVFSQHNILIILAILGLLITFSLVLNSIIPWVLNLVPSLRAGLGIGLYFGGFNIGIAILEIVLLYWLKFTPIVGAIGVAIAFLAASFWIYLSQKIKPQLDHA